MCKENVISIVLLDIFLNNLIETDTETGRKMYQISLKNPDRSIPNQDDELLMENHSGRGKCAFQ